MADNFRKNFNSKENYSKLSKEGITEKTTDWVTWDKDLAKI